MPIAFNTQSHGEIPIGFFNIETDMILIKNYFIFASDFCNLVIDLTSSDKESCISKEFYIIKNPKDIGNLMGAISGVEFTGFIGELYKKFPFPKNVNDFKQNPWGFKNRGTVEKIIQKFAKKEIISIMISKKNDTISIGEYVFDHFDFHQVLLYIWQGGMPRWRDDERPDYVTEMMKAVISSKHWLFEQGNNKNLRGGDT